MSLSVSLSVFLVLSLVHICDPAYVTVLFPVRVLSMSLSVSLNDPKYGQSHPTKVYLPIDYCAVAMGPPNLTLNMVSHTQHSYYALFFIVIRIRVNTSNRMLMLKKN
jgi:hypothetical protein